MAEVSIRELRNHGGEVVDRVIHGESLVVTRDGTPVAELRPLPRPGANIMTILERWRHLPALDGDRLRRDIDAMVDQSL